MFTTVTLLFFALLNLPALSQQRQEPSVQVKNEAGTPEDALRAVNTWMQCTECTAEDLKRVAQFGPNCIPVLDTFLRRGPSIEDRSAMQASLKTQYRALKEFEKGHPKNRVTLSEKQFVKTYLSNLDAHYRKRAAAAVAEIGGAEARTILQRALKERQRPDVKFVLEHALETVNRKSSQ